MKEYFKDLPVLFFKDPKEWERWLKKNHSDATPIWIKLAKKESKIISLCYADALDVALCYGWIDSQKQKFDDSFWLQKFSIRGPKSIWSKINREKTKVLIKDGKMKPAGLKAIEAAKKDGRWDAAYDSQSKIEVPKDFENLLKQNPVAKNFFESLDSANRYAILFRLHHSKKEETRIKKIGEWIEMWNRKKTILNPSKK
ncbi:YdeI/OmpD-associated family protein [Leptospira sp. 201903070]|uniref:YdeI/OmpD-associated family protein n=1 Tax=Leptospira ainlahdjerensis TaxID=2810033 RepID=A0ABS2UA64_9LEPT|nr:YdeI/OmpD-associated family protein [Leptospira ainlahdjerensis]MBM9577263.1 YdeI/OmpD-associated family protein [Leptospira ainlahdjerensis]